MKFSHPRDLARYFDHTALKPETSRSDIETLCDEARQLGVAAVCVNPVWVSLAAKLLQGTEVLPITVVGFPLGANLTSAKVYEARECMAHGAREIDMVLSVGLLKSYQHEAVRHDIQAVHKACGDIPLKVILETSLLRSDDISLVTKWCAEDGVAFVKTSTGFGSRGASVEDIQLMKAAIAAVPGAKTKIKASGGIRTLGDVLRLIEAGADRIGASATINIIKELAGGAASSKHGY